MRWRPSIASFRSRLFRYSLRSAILFVTVVCIILGMYVKQARDEQHATDVVQSLGGCAVFDYQWEQMNRTGAAAKATPTPPRFQKLRQIFGDHYFSSVVAVTIPYHVTVPLNANVVASLRNLRSLELSGTHVSDDDLPIIARLKHLETLLLADTDVTNRGMRYLDTMPKLRTLSLRGTTITDIGLLALIEQRSLQQLDISDTGVTGRAIEQFRLERPDCQIEFGVLATQPPLPW